MRRPQPSPATRTAADYVIVLGVVLAVVPLVLVVDGLRSGHVDPGRIQVVAALATHGLGILCWPAATVLILCGAGVARLEAACGRVAAGSLAGVAAVLMAVAPGPGVREPVLRVVALATAAGVALLFRPAVRRDLGRRVLRLV